MPKRFGFFIGNIEEFVNIEVKVAAGRFNEVDESRYLGVHKCNESDHKYFNLPLDKSKFEEMKIRLSFMLCLDNPSDLILQGPGSSIREKSLSLKIDRCINHDSCSDAGAID